MVKVFIFKKEKMLSKKYMAEKYYGCDKDTIYSNKENFVNFLNAIEE